MSTKCNTNISVQHNLIGLCSLLKETWSKCLSVFYVSYSFEYYGERSFMTSICFTVNFIIHFDSADSRMQDWL